MAKDDAPRASVDVDQVGSLGRSENIRYWRTWVMTLQPSEIRCAVQYGEQKKSAGVGGQIAQARFEHRLESGTKLKYFRQFPIAQELGLAEFSW
jgi:hypothetical protein